MEVGESADVQAAIDSGAITVTDENGTPITTACCLGGGESHYMILMFLNDGDNHESASSSNWKFLSSLVFDRDVIKTGFTATLRARVSEGNSDTGEVRIYDNVNGTVGTVSWGNTTGWEWKSADITAGIANSGLLELDAQMRRSAGFGNVNVSHVIVEIKGT